MCEWKIHHQTETVSTNLDARAGVPGDVYTADFQTAGRGRLDHKWLSPPGTNLMMSVVLSVANLSPEQVSTLPLVVGLAVSDALSSFFRGLSPHKNGGLSPAIKWPNDVWVAGKKIAGILCERQGDVVIAGMGVNVGQREFSPELAEKATSLSLIISDQGVCPHKNGVCPHTKTGVCPQVVDVRDAVLAKLDEWVACWRKGGFLAVYPALVRMDVLRGRTISVRQTDGDTAPITGLSAGIQSDGTLDVGGVKVYAGEAHVEI